MLLPFPLLEGPPTGLGFGMAIPPELCALLLYLLLLRRICCVCAPSRCFHRLSLRCTERTCVAAVPRFHRLCWPGSAVTGLESFGLGCGVGSIKVAKLRCVVEDSDAVLDSERPRVWLAVLTSHASAHGTTTTWKAESFIPGTAQQGRMPTSPLNERTSDHRSLRL